MINLSKINTKYEQNINETNILIKYSNNSYYLGSKNFSNLNYGKYFSKDYDYYGYWLNNKPHKKGFIKDKINNIKYEGNIINGYPEGDGIETYTNDYKYLGTFLKGKKHGYGKIVYNKIIIYEGLWYENTIVNNNESKNIFDKNGNLKYNVKYIDFINNFYSINDYGIEYFPNTKIKYEGSFLNTTYDGFGKLYNYQNGNYWKVYEGMFENNMFNGKGTLYNIDGSIYYIGNFKNNIIDENFVTVFNNSFEENFYFHGIIEKSVLLNNYYPNIILKEGVLHNYKNNIIYKGEFKSVIIENKIINKLCGNNKCIIEKIIEVVDNNIIDKKLIFEGYIDENKYNGTIILKDNLKFIGKFNLKKENDFNNLNYIEGSLSKKENNKYVLLSQGKYMNNLLNGNGKIYRNGVLLKEGYFKNNVLNGQGISYYLNGNKEYQGNFYRGYRHGYGKLFDCEQNLIYESQFYYNNPTD